MIFLLCVLYSDSHSQWNSTFFGSVCMSVLGEKGIFGLLVLFSGHSCLPKKTQASSSCSHHHLRMQLCVASQMDNNVLITNLYLILVSFI